jgi:protein-tyrosine phosphatase
MIDTHAHILPGMDDGANNAAQSVEFIQTADAQGVKTIFATPHACDGVFNCKKTDILQKCSQLQTQLRDQGISTQVLPGAEIRINHDIVTDFDKGSLLTMNDGNKFLLVELPLIFISKAISMMFRQLRERGVTPIIAHAERNPMILNNPGLVADFVYNGAAIQVTASSLTGEFGKQAMKAAQTMVSLDQVFCIGSDIHPGRKYRMAHAANRLIKLVGRTRAGQILFENPSVMLEGADENSNRIYMEKVY